MNEYKQEVYSHPEKGLNRYIDKMGILSRGIIYIHKNRKQIESTQFIQSESKAGRIPSSERDNWLEVGYKNLNGNRPKAKWFF